MKKILTICLFILFFATTVDAYTFYRSLNTGSEGEDVRQLQIFLNNYSNETKVASSGAGSPGNETSYFGNLTKSAVTRLQNINRSEILIPVGLNQGTGYFGPSTISFIKSLSNNTAHQDENLNSQTAMNNSSSSSGADEFLILQKNKFVGGENALIGSSYKISDINFYIDGKKLEKECEFENLCEIVIKSEQTGEKILVTDSIKIKEEKIIIESDNKKPSISLNKIKLSEKNTIEGKNLTETIRVYSPFGNFETTARDDSFEVSFINNLKELPDYLKKGPFYIENSNGLISDIIIIDYEI